MSHPAEITTSFLAVSIRSCSLPRSVKVPAQLVRGRGDERLLAVRAIQVAVVQAVALAHERQRLRPVQCLVPGREVGAGVAVLHRMVEAYLDPAQRGGQVVEAGQVDLGEPVDRHVQETPHRLQGLLPPGLPAPLLQLGAGDALFSEVLLGVELRQPVRLLDLGVGVAGDALHRDVVVAGDGHGGGFAAVAGDVHQDQRVGVVATLDAVPGVQLVEDLLRQLVAVLVFAGVQPDQQDVLILTRRLRGRGVQRVRRAQPVDQAAHHGRGDPGSGQHQQRHDAHRHPARHPQRTAAPGSP
jgi:hypothetical protein